MNRRPALRVDDPGIHAACCGVNTWTATAGSATVFINGKGAHRMGDRTRHCGGTGTLIEGSPNVIVGESAGGGPGHSAGSQRSAGGASSAGASSSAAAQETTARDAPPGDAAPPATGAAAAGPAEPESAAPVPTTAEPASSPASDEPTWLEIVLLGDDGNGVAGERYAVSLPGGARRTGFLDDDGRARLDDISPGEYQVSFLDLDSEAWQPADG